MKRTNGIYSDLIDMSEAELRIHADFVATKKTDTQKHLKAMIRNIELLEAEQKAIAAILKSKIPDLQLIDITYGTGFQFPERPTNQHRSVKTRDSSVTFDETM